MYRQMIIGLFFCFTSLLSNGGDGEFAVSRIPPAMLKNANAVVRVYDMSFEIISRNKAIQKTRYVITILNENGERWSSFSEYYTKFRKIESVEGVLYDASGNGIKKMKMKDAVDLSGYDEGSLIDDFRYKRHSFFHRVYPYTIEYSCEIEFNSTLIFPNWVGIPGERVSVEKSNVVLTCPIDYEFRFKTFNYPGEPARVQKEKTKSASWSVSNLPAILKEPYSPMWHELAPYIIFGPTEFQMEDYKGNMSSWKEFGKFVYALKQGRDILPDPVRQKVHELTDGIPDTKNKIKALYNYLQKNTRYISIQLGIGGWQPFDAKYVAAKSYGDCKALTNYMFSLLKEAGIPSYYALVQSGRNEGYITDDFPSQQFNHVILCVPQQKDTTWLECTSQTLPAGYIGSFTCNRYALLVTEEGGHLVRTITYGIKENLQDRRIRAKLNEDGSLEVKTVTRYDGLQQDEIHALINQLSKDKVKEYLHEFLDFATYDISRFEYNEEKNTLPSVVEELDITVANYANITGKRIFIIPNIMTRTSRKAAEDPDRKYDIQLGIAYQDIDSVAIDLPGGYSAESMPQDITLNSPFGKYSCSVKLSGKQLIYNRSIEFYGGRFPASEYPAMVKFFESIYKADRNKVVLVKTELPVKGF